MGRQRLGREDGAGLPSHGPLSGHLFQGGCLALGDHGRLTTIEANDEDVLGARCRMQGESEREDQDEGKKTHRRGGPNVEQGTWLPIIGHVIDNFVNNRPIPSALFDIAVLASRAVTSKREIFTPLRSCSSLAVFICATVRAASSKGSAVA